MVLDFFLYPVILCFVGCFCTLCQKLFDALAPRLLDIKANITSCYLGGNLAFILIKFKSRRIEL